MCIYQSESHETNARYAVPDAVAMLRAIDPLFAATPIYIVCKTDRNREWLPDGPADCRAWTSPLLDLVCEPYLTAHGQWQGRGFCMILNEHVASFDDADFVGTVCHEAAHFAESKISNMENHGPLWARACLHLVHRANMWLGARGAPLIAIQDRMRMSLYGRSPASRYAAALGDEVFQVSKPVCWHLRQSPPMAFAYLCNQDARRNGQALPYLQHDSPSAPTQARSLAGSTATTQAAPTPTRPRRRTNYMLLRGQLLTTNPDGSMFLGDEPITEKQYQDLLHPARKPRAVRTARVAGARHAGVMM